VVFFVVLFPCRGPGVFCIDSFVPCFKYNFSNCCYFLVKYQALL